MRNVSEVAEEVKAHISRSIIFSPPKIVPFIRKRRKIRYSQTGHWWEYNTEHLLCMLDN